MTSCMERCSVNVPCIEEVPYEVKVALECLTSSKPQLGRNVFTACHVSKHPNAADAKVFLDRVCPQLRRDMETQRLSVQHNKLAKTSEFVEKNETSFIMTEEEKQISVKCLLRTAAERDMKLARAWNYPPDVTQLIHRTWQAILYQADNLLRGVASEDDDGTFLHCSSREALENISSMGIWFTGDMSVPLRRYSLQLADANGSLQEVIAVGVATFAYSTYVVSSRQQSQDATLAELDRLSTRLSLNVRFLPPLVLPVEQRQQEEEE